jgi:lactoylglutathione lyase
MKAVFKTAIPYADDALNLPVKDVESAIPYYVRTFGFRVVSRQASPYSLAILARDGVQIGLAENGGDPTQEGCFFEVDDVEAAYAEIKGRPTEPGSIKTEDVNGRKYRAFFDVAPDGLCYMIAQPVVGER